MSQESFGETQRIQVEDRVDIECCGATDIGRRRELNQDHFVVGDLRKHLAAEYSSVKLGPQDTFGDPMGKLLLVADGMGGANAGDVASELAVKSTVDYLLGSMHWLFHPSEVEVEQFVSDLKEAACFSHYAVRSDAENDPTHRGMGSTLTVAYVVWPMMYVLHIGDSRCYLLRDNQLGLLTKDQTFAQHLYDHGQLTDEEFKESNYHNVLLSAIGIEGQPDAVVYRQRLEFGDRVMLCSDGVNLHLNDDQICESMKKEVSAESICREIIDLANEEGGHDNITTVVAKFLRPS